MASPNIDKPAISVFVYSTVDQNHDAPGLVLGVSRQLVLDPASEIFFTKRSLAG